MEGRDHRRRREPVRRHARRAPGGHPRAATVRVRAGRGDSRRQLRLRRRRRLRRPNRLGTPTSSIPTIAGTRVRTDPARRPGGGAVATSERPPTLEASARLDPHRHDSQRDLARPAGMRALCSSGCSSRRTGRWRRRSCWRVLGATDWVDGWIARHFDQGSELGKVLDPTADRVLLVAAAVALDRGRAGPGLGGLGRARPGGS